jgi:hypothetical protein
MVPLSPNQYGRQQDCKLKCSMGFPQQASTHQHEILCQQPTSLSELAYAQEASTLAVQRNTNHIWPKKPVHARQRHIGSSVTRMHQACSKIVGSLLYYLQAVKLVALNAISAQQAKATEHMEQLKESSPQLCRYITQ